MQQGNAYILDKLNHDGRGKWWRTLGLHRFSI